MKILSIAWKQIKHDVRDIRSFLFMLAFPIVLMVILGSALSNVFNNEIELGEMNVLYKDNTRNELGVAFKAFAVKAEESDIHFKEIQNIEKARNKVKAGKVDAYLVLNKNGISYHASRPDSIEANVIEGMLQTFAGYYKTGRVIIQSNPSKASEILAQPSRSDYIQEGSIARNKQPSSMDYYAIVMTTMITLYSAIAASHLVSSEREAHTAERLIVAPVRKLEIFVGKVAGSICINAFFIAAVVAFSYFVLKVEWGTTPGQWFLSGTLLLTEVIAAVSLGLGLSLIARTPAASRMIIMVIVQIASFFGGAYFKIDHPEGLLKTLVNLSPLTWENEGIMRLIYTGDQIFIVKVMAMNIGVALLFLLVSLVTLRRREGL
ncbi:ABC transporter permease [Aciduricibacillus chroicocephali]|uniref:ABC transporter permease n=1 Tax=Aciduricibacillus chroicocephali TaxID=3054939 RepID=A0ABY9KW77_9BACI|nr:ABC transporter permease [Bacillaceae bacterium 44XB]